VPPTFDLDGPLDGHDRRECLTLLAAAALLSLGEGGDAGGEAAFYSPDQPRDRTGKWTAGVGAQTAADRERARDYARTFLAGRSVLPGVNERELLARHLAMLTVKDLHALRREHGLGTVPGRKADLVAHLAGQIHAIRAQNSSQELLTTSPVNGTIPVESKQGTTGVRTMTTQQELPALAGAEKQVAWAQEVRGRVVEGARAQLASARENAAKHGWPKFERLARVAERALELIHSPAAASAKEWIDLRSDRDPLGYLVARDLASHPAVGAALDAAGGDADRLERRILTPREPRPGKPGGYRDDQDARTVTTGDPALDELAGRYGPAVVAGAVRHADMLRLRGGR
jgi:hypothetical protein